MTCIGKDPRCPCQDGDACHYKDCGGTKAWPVPKAEPPPEWPLIKNILDEYGLQAIDFVAEFKAAQQQAEPVAYFDFQDLKFSWAKHMKIGPVPVSIKVEPMKLYLEAPQQQAEPTCPDCKAAVLYECVACSNNNYPPKQQAEPPQRQWVGLTEDDIAQAMCRADAIFTGPMQFKFAKELEAKLKERNT